MKITENAGLKFKEFDDEVFRVYEFPNGSEVRIDEPVAINVSASGGHRLLDAKGVSHYIPKGWIHLYWQVKEGREAFAF